MQQKENMYIYIYIYIYIYMINEISKTAIDNVNEVRIMYVNYET